MCLHRYLLGRKLGVIKVIWEKRLSVFSKVIVEGLLCSGRGKEIRFGEQLTGFISVAEPPHRSIGPSLAALSWAKESGDQAYGVTEPKLSTKKYIPGWVSAQQNTVEWGGGRREEGV